MPIDPFLLLVIAVALLFDYVNGFHDTANAVATSVSTRALKPEQAVVLSAAANFIGALSGTAVAKTIGGGLVDEQLLSRIDPALHYVLAALIGAIVWNLTTWRLGIPSSSSHALIGGLLGAAMAAAGPESIRGEAVAAKVIVPLITSPAIGFVGALALMVVVFHLFRRANPSRLNERFRRIQILSAAYMALSHGSNDAQKTMGVITLALFSAGQITQLEVPLWVILAAATAMSLGTAAGGWRIIRTMGQRVVKLDPVHGFAAETAAATVILGASHLGMPVSTTHVISSAIMGAGASDRPAAVRWTIVWDILVAWVLTIPAAGLVAAGCDLLLRALAG